MRTLNHDLVEQSSRFQFLNDQRALFYRADKVIPHDFSLYLLPH